MRTPMKILFRAFAVGVAVFQAGVSGTGDTPAPLAGAPGPDAGRSITLPHFEPTLAAAPGRDEFLAVCVSCHSPRYVTLQPLFSRRQWEETVDKMAKVYGAPMGQEQRQPIIDYLVAIHGPDSDKAGAAADEDSAFTAPAVPPARPDTAPLLKPAAEAAAHQAEVNHGAELFQQDCAACHGTAGRGDGWVGRVLLRRPENLAAIRFSPRLLGQALWNGKPGTAMPSWRNLSPGDLTALAAYVQTLHPPDTAAPASSEALQRGNLLFQQNCVPCHGVLADGKGVSAASLMPPPANFRWKQPDFDYILQILRDGISGTGMPSWKSQLSEADRRALAGFVRSRFETASASAP